ncbi:hypothetical protein HALLA_02760 (plasmid) [Halostagnicola larsenii XH-48]|uniref:Uncharacterized protein n=1 Tax=Halostagnicola larsenii XH-48 TaxID=797299 RepID=W0JVR3_9EURY|nr:hypothetical protein HALLA_02760 [Halostagnicola larsenii XH-48]
MDTTVDIKIVSQRDGGDTNRLRIDLAVFFVGIPIN